MSTINDPDNWGPANIPKFANGGIIVGEPMPPALRADDLSAKHIGLNVRITDRGDIHTGHIADLEFNVDRMMCGDRAESVRVIFAESATITYPLKATVEVLS